MDSEASRNHSQYVTRNALLALTILLGVAIPLIALAQDQDSQLTDPESGTACPLGRIAVVRGSDSEARDGGGFEASRGHGAIHGAVDLNGSVGEPVFAVANGKIEVASRTDWGKLGKTVIIDHLDGGHTIYGHLNTVEVSLNSHVTAGQLIGTIGYSGNARKLRLKNLPPHLHFAYVRGLAPLASIKGAGDGAGIALASHNVLAGVTGVLHPIWAVRFLKCWENSLPQGAPTLPSTLIMR
jgi:murein DD-endopeptidase MepM/ murein hydrolase activator NlpD